MLSGISLVARALSLFPALPIVEIRNTYLANKVVSLVYQLMAYTRPTGLGTVVSFHALSLARSHSHSIRFLVFNRSSSMK
uniref:Uncharacterized protein n=2 Tax=Culex quinquefasciatus TaxID=7176 RepID=A0A1S4KDP7_CULQU